MIKKKEYILAILFFVFINYTKAQQLSLYTNYLTNNYAYNPAIAGYKPHAVVNLNYRNQWVGFNDAPKNYLLSLHSPIGIQKKVGVGAMIISDNTGMIGKTSGYLTFAYHLKLNEIYKLSFGISAGMAQYRIKLYDAKTADAGDELLTGNLLTNNVFDSNMGLYLHSNKLFFGISGYQYLRNKITWKDSKSNLSPHVYSTIGYTFKVSDEINLEPSALLKFNNPVPFQPEYSLRGIYKGLVWLGFSYRSKDAASALLGINIKEKITVAYAYDFTVSKLRTYSSGTNEISFIYQFVKKKKKLDADEEELNNIDNSIKSKLKKDEENTK